MIFVDEDMAVDHHQGGPEPAHYGQHPGEGEGSPVSAQIVDGAADQETLTEIIRNSCLLSSTRSHSRSRSRSGQVRL